MSDTDRLLRMMMALPPQTDQIRQLLDRRPLGREAISETFCRFAETCAFEYGDFVQCHGREPLDEEVHGAYVLPLCRLLLEYGLDPNYVFGEVYSQSNAMYEVYWIDQPYAAADTLRLLLEHGGDPYLPIDNESLWHLADGDLWFDIAYGYAQEDAYSPRFDNRFHFWLVLRSFLSPEDAAYRDHARYTYRLVRTDPSHWDLQILQKNPTD